MTTDQTIDMSDGSWHREAGRQCWVRTKPGPVETFNTIQAAQARVAVLVPPGTVLYQSDWSNGLGGWQGSGGWTVFNGTLLFDGTGQGSHLKMMYVPYQISVQNYAIEAVFQYARPLESPSAGIFFRGSAEMGPSRGTWYEAANDGRNQVSIREERSYASIASGRTTFLGQTITHRIENRGNAIRYFVNGQLVVETVANKYLNQNMAGIHTYNADEFSVISFRIIKL